MPQPLLTVIIPTIARPTLGRLLDSIPDEPDLEILIVGDSYGQDFVPDIQRAMLNYAGHNRRWLLHDGGLHMVGHPQRNVGMERARGRWLVFSQDDNIYMSGAFDVIRSAINELSEPGPMLFKVDTWQAGIVWRYQGMLAEGNVDADCIVVPNVPDKLAVWPNVYQGDATFIIDTIGKWNGSVTWRDEMIAVARPEVA